VFEKATKSDVQKAINPMYFFIVFNNQSEKDGLSKVVKLFYISSKIRGLEVGPKQWRAQGGALGGLSPPPKSEKSKIYHKGPPL